MMTQESVKFKFKPVTKQYVLTAFRGLKEYKSPGLKEVRCDMRFGPLMRFGPGPKRIAKSAMHFGPDRIAWQSVLCILVRTHTHSNLKPCKGVHFGWTYTHGKHHHAFWSGHIRIAI